MLTIICSSCSYGRAILIIGGFYSFPRANDGSFGLAPAADADTVPAAPEGGSGHRVGLVVLALMLTTVLVGKASLCSCWRSPLLRHVVVLRSVGRIGGVLDSWRDMLALLVSACCDPCLWRASAIVVQNHSSGGIIMSSEVVAIVVAGLMVGCELSIAAFIHQLWIRFQRMHLPEQVLSPGDGSSRRSGALHSC